MVRVAGVNIPDNKRVTISLRYIYGIGPKKADEICLAMNIPSQKRVKELADFELSAIQDFISNNFLVEGDLRRKHYNDIKRLIDIRCYRGVRHRSRMPVRGQRTRCNASTARKRSIF